MKRNNIFKKWEEYLYRAKELYKEKGAYYVIHSGIKNIFFWLTTSFWYSYYKIFKSSRIFTFQGEKYYYYYHKYNTTWRNERAVEIPIICRILNNNINRNILEVGNTLSHYFPVNHTILDKYEKADGVVNQDVVDFQQSKKYDLIVSISTLEHVGWDEEPRDPAKIMRAFENLKNLLVSGGKIVVTLPLGENNEMDKRLIEGKIQFTEQYCMKRISKDNKWIEVNWNDMCKGKDDSFFIAGNGLVIGIIEEK